MIPNTKIGVDHSFDTIQNDFDAVLIGIGAWVSTGVGCPGEDAEGVIGGIDFLRSVVRNEDIDIGEKVAIVGGGNTAMDACRTAVRLGARKFTTSTEEPKTKCLPTESRSKKRRKKA